ncbi:MAG: pilW-3 [Deltaproteobacteria bacterium]|nr:pilW-3 [Deltaproteobacteria bacterium]
MRRNESGISLLEVVIALAIVMLVLYAAMTFFIGTVRQYKVQTKIIETNVEGVLGLELLRRDVESLGFGLPWDNGVSYTERSGVASEITALNDSPGAPRPVLSVDNASFTVNSSDYLVIRSARVGSSDAAGKWTILQTGPVTRPWGSAEEDLSGTDRVIVIAPGGVNQNRRTLVTPVGGTNFSSLAAYAPIDANQANIVYGIDNGTLVRPFNRAEYYIDDTAGTVPPRCAANTGVLVKAVVEHDPNGTTPVLLPLLDCVADMQVVYGLDTNADRAVEDWEDDITPLSAGMIRTQLVEVRVHILAQEGQRDPSYTHTASSVTVGSEGAGRSFDLNGIIGSGYQHYRWKVYSIVVKPRNLAN